MQEENIFSIFFYIGKRSITKSGCSIKTVTLENFNMLFKFNQIITNYTQL